MLRDTINVATLIKEWYFYFLVSVREHTSAQCNAKNISPQRINKTNKNHNELHLKSINVRKSTVYEINERAINLLHSYRTKKQTLSMGSVTLHSFLLLHG